MVRVVAAADRVEIRRLDHRDVAQHPFAGDRPAAPGIELVPVHSVQLDRSAVEEELPVAHLDRTETGPEMADVENPVPAAQCDGDGVQLRRFGAPPLRSRYRCCQRTSAGRLRRNRAGRITHDEFERQGAVPPLDLHLGTDRSRFRVGRHRGVGDENLRRGVGEDAAENAGEPPEILIFQITCARIFVTLRRDDVFSGADQSRHVEFGRSHRILAVPGENAVDPEPEGGLHPGEVQHDAAAAPLLRQHEAAAETAGRIALCPGGPVFRRFSHHMRRVAVERIGDVAVNRCAVSGAFEIGGQFDLIPSGVVESGRLEAAGFLFRNRRPVQFPGAVERKPPVADVVQKFVRRDRKAFRRPRRRARRQLADSEHGRIFQQIDEFAHVYILLWLPVR